MRKIYCAHLRLLLPVLFLLYCPDRAIAQLYNYNPEPAPQGALQAGFQVSYVRPRNEFGFDFKATTGYELYIQLRSKDGGGPFSGRIGLFYTDLKPRLDTIPTYLIQENPTLLLPGYIVYYKLNFKGLFIDYAYTLARYKNLRLDAGLGIIVGQYHIEYSQGYATVLTIDHTRASMRNLQASCLS